MHPEIRTTLYLIGALTAVAAASLTVLFSGKAWFKAQYRRSARIRAGFAAHLAGGPLPPFPKSGFRLFLREFSRLGDEFVVPPALREAVRREIGARRLLPRWKRALRRGDRAARMEAATFLGVHGGADAVRALVAQLGADRSLLVRLRIAHTLTTMGSVEAIPAIADTLRDSPDWYRYRLIEILMGFGSELREYVEDRLEAGDREAVPLALAYGRRYLSSSIQNAIVSEALSDGPDAAEAADVLAARYPRRLRQRDFLDHPSLEIRRRAWGALAHFPDRDTLDLLLAVMADPALSGTAAGAAAEIVRQSPGLLPHLLDSFEAELRSAAGEDSAKAAALSVVLAARMDYFVYGGRRIDLLIGFLVRRGRVAALASFFRANRNAEIEDSLVAVLRGVATDADRDALASALDPEILGKLGIPPAPPIKRRNALQIGKGAKAFLWVLAAAVLFLPPALFLLLSRGTDRTAWEALTRYIVEYNYAFAFYSLAVNSIYLGLLGLSVAQLIAQLRLWGQTRSSFLVTERMMAPVSIIVPAYREEASIVENVRSLLSLDYPQFEIIVVCDGSPDATLERVTSAFSMERSDQAVPAKLPSAPIRGVYRCREYPYLTVVDKANGGKADALNAGINFASHDYLCCVDADSLLESDALIKIMYQAISDGGELVACGGNILPVNGCSVRLGAITRYAAPRAPLALFQTVEYLRAFLAGRLGWAFLRSLLIISGAFGVFSRRRVLEIGGYLTGEGAGKLDTVGEDMELVVRLSRHMRGRRIPFRIGYAFNANCWTEVPEDWTSLRKQRSRWHRGLLEILLYHRACAFNPKYGTMGLIGLPYFFAFEVVGPFFEIIGLAMIPLAAALGLMNPPLALLLFAATIVFGIAISTAALAISEFRVAYFSRRETMKLILFAVLENFGYRQLMSFLRVSSYFSILAGTSGWGSMKRKGFSREKAGS